MSVHWQTTNVDPYQQCNTCKAYSFVKYITQNLDSSNTLAQLSLTIVEIHHLTNVSSQVHWPFSQQAHLFYVYLSNDNLTLTLAKNIVEPSLFFTISSCCCRRNLAGPQNLSHYTESSEQPVSYQLLFTYIFTVLSIRNFHLNHRNTKNFFDSCSSTESSSIYL